MSRGVSATLAVAHLNLGRGATAAVAYLDFGQPDREARGAASW